MPKILALLRRAYGREVPENPCEWHSRDLFIPAITLDGRWATRVWRRMAEHGSWEYRYRPETEEEWLDRQW